MQHLLPNLSGTREQNIVQGKRLHKQLLVPDFISSQKPLVYMGWGEREEKIGECMHLLEEHLLSDAIAKQQGRGKQGGRMGDEHL